MQFQIHTASVKWWRFPRRRTKTVTKSLTHESTKCTVTHRQKHRRRQSMTDAQRGCDVIHCWTSHSKFFRHVNPGFIWLPQTHKRFPFLCGHCLAQHRHPSKMCLFLSSKRFFAAYGGWRACSRQNRSFRLESCLRLPSLRTAQPESWKVTNTGSDKAQ